MSAVCYTLHLDVVFQKYPYPTHARCFILKAPPPSLWKFPRNFQQPQRVGMDIYCNLAMFGQIILWPITNNNVPYLTTFFILIVGLFNIVLFIMLGEIRFVSPLGILGLMNRVLHEEHSLQWYLKLLSLEINIILL